MVSANMLARQAIYTSTHEVYGFELFYRNDDDFIDVFNRNMNGICDFTATSELLANLCTCALEENLNGKGLLFIKLDEAFITSDMFFPDQAHNIVFEILDSVPPTTDVLNAISIMHKKGFKFALDEYAFEASKEPFIPFVSFLKINTLAVSLETIKEGVSRLENASMTLLGYNVEKGCCFDSCYEMGFHLFQGYYLESPIMIQGKKISTNRQTALRLMATLCKEDVSVDEVAEVVSSDPRIIYKILKLINCPLYPFKREIVNIKEAIVMLGLETIRQWTLTLLLSSESEQPQELFRTLLVRAKTCELYAENITNVRKSDYFTLGIFSGIEAILGIELNVLLSEIKLALPTRTLLVNQLNNDDSLLNIVKAVERDDIRKFSQLPEQMLPQIKACFSQGIKWADELMEQLV